MTTGFPNIGPAGTAGSGVASWGGVLGTGLVGVVSSGIGLIFHRLN